MSYVLTTLDGKYVGIDDGGYPYITSSISNIKEWSRIFLAVAYRNKFFKESEWEIREFISLNLGEPIKTSEYEWEIVSTQNIRIVWMCQFCNHGHTTSDLRTVNKMCRCGQYMQVIGAEVRRTK